MSLGMRYFSYVATQQYTLNKVLIRMEAGTRPASIKNNKLKDYEVNNQKLVIDFHSKVKVYRLSWRQSKRTAGQSTVIYSDCSFSSRC